MTTPGSNILREALMTINPSRIEFYRSTGRVLNTLGQYVTTYAAPAPFPASVQPVARDKYVELGLNMSHEYVTVFGMLDVNSIERGKTGDRVRTKDGRLWQVESITDWHSEDGWVEAICVLTVEPPP
jgi:hypothetical protein